MNIFKYQKFIKLSAQTSKLPRRCSSGTNKKNLSKIFFWQSLISHYFIFQRQDDDNPYKSFSNLMTKTLKKSTVELLESNSHLKYIIYKNRQL